MVHGRTYYRCHCFRFGCPCCTDGKPHGAEPIFGKDMVLPQFCEKHGGPPDKVQQYEVYDHILDGGKTEKRIRKVKETAQAGK